MCPPPPSCPTQFPPQKMHTYAHLDQLAYSFSLYGTLPIPAPPTHTCPPHTTPCSTHGWGCSDLQGCMEQERYRGYNLLKESDWRKSPKL